MSSAQDSVEGVELAWLLAGLVAAPRVTVRDLTLDSRGVHPGDAFVALAGRGSHGLDYVDDAIARGAAAVLWDPAEGRALPPLPPAVTTVAVPALRSELGDLADRFYGEPSSDATLAGITGTNGKTTCAWLLAQCYGARGAYLGTLGQGRPPELAAGTHTTPDCIALHRALRRLVDAGARRIALEVSSHALDQQRVAGARLPLTAFTNLTREHLDYHGTMAAYGAAKERLFHCRGVAHAVINVGDGVGRELATRLPAGVALTRVDARPAAAPPTGAARGAASFVAATRVRPLAAGLEIEGATQHGAFQLRSPLVGQFNAENLLLVLGLLLAGGMPQAEALATLASASAPPGRLERFACGRNGPTLVVDYAHTPDALAKALAALRLHTPGRLWCVFGCGGDRDPGKRPQMAAAAEAGADALVVTDDNPRTEDPERIVAMITAGLAGRVEAHVERDRTRAIEFAARRARAGDVVLIAGKGHEDYQIYGHERRPASDRALARALAEAAQ